MTDALARARADLAAGRPWKARDRLTGLLTVRQDSELLDLLATVHFEMQDLPAAGALWFVTGRSDADALQAIAAWRERFGNDEARLLSLPRVLRVNASASPIRELHQSAEKVTEARRTQRQAEWRAAQPADPAALVFGCVLTGLLICLIGLILVGLGTVVAWL